MVFDRWYGNLFSSRKYSGSSYAQNNMIKSIIISSDLKYRAYVVSNYKTSAGACLGN